MQILVRLAVVMVLSSIVCADNHDSFSPDRNRDQTCERHTSILGRSTEEPLDVEVFKGYVACCDELKPLPPNTASQIKGKWIRSNTTALLGTGCQPISKTTDKEMYTWQGLHNVFSKNCKNLKKSSRGACCKYAEWFGPSGGNLVPDLVCLDMLGTPINPPSY